MLAGKTVTSIAQEGYPLWWNISATHVCAIANGQLYCWGGNDHGQLGDNTTTDRSSPVAVYAGGVLSGKTVTDVQLGLRHSCALASGGVYCWGFNGDGQLADNTWTNRRVPVAVTLQPATLLQATP